jgi:hypothetical protein
MPAFKADDAETLSFQGFSDCTDQVIGEKSTDGSAAKRQGVTTPRP